MADNDDVPVVTDKPKKRKILGSKQEQAKKQRLQSHTTGPDCNCTRLMCFQTVNEQNRAKLIDTFNALPSKDAQDSYLASLITVTEVKRRRPRVEDHKEGHNNSYFYKVFVERGADEGPDAFAYVCYQAFMSIFGIGRGRLDGIKRSVATTGMPPTDGRGKHGNHPHKMTDEQRQRIRDHISSFRGRQSHYSQEKTRRLYLSEDLNISKMYELFKEKHPDDNIVYETYRIIFNNDFNIGFGYPRTDTCSSCDQFLIKIKGLSTRIESDPENYELKQELQDVETQRDLHQRKADTFYRRKRDAKKRAKLSPYMEAYTFDYQKNLNLPNKSTNDFYYHRKLSYFSFNIHQLSSDGVFIYGYDETTAKKGSDEVTSFLDHHFEHHVPKEVTHIELFCDSCAGQNKNYTLIRFLDYLVHHKKRFQSIKLCFPERGHSYMECDRDMGNINTKAHVSLPSEWAQIFRSARKSPSPFYVVEVTQPMIKNFSQFLRPYYKKSCPIPTRPIREITFDDTEAPGTVRHRDTWNGTFLKTSVNVPTRKKKNRVCEGEPALLYSDRLNISAAKYKDLQTLKKFSTDPSFYDDLPHDDQVPDEHEVVV